VKGNIQEVIDHIVLVQAHTAKL